MEKVKDFVAIDFEWQSPDHDPCAVGMVRVMNGVVVNKFYSLIHPKVHVWEEHTCYKHGITAEMVKDAPMLAELEPMIEFVAGGLLLIGHNYKTAERCVIEEHFREGSPLKNAHFIDTYEMVKGKLDERCAEYGIPMGEHHNALDDAEAAALLFMKLQGEEMVKPQPKEKPKGKMQGSKRDSSLNVAADLETVDCKDNPFYGKIFVLSGFPNAERDALIKVINSKLGGTNRNAVNSKTGILVSHSSQDGSENKEKGSKRKDAIANNVPWYREDWLRDVFVHYELEDEWKEIFG